MYLGKEPQFTQFPSKFFNGDGTAMTVSLDYSPPNEAALLVFIDGVRQDTDAYNLSGTSLTFTGTVASGTNNVQVVHMGLAMDVGVPGDDTISTAKIQDDAVTAAKLANSINTEIAANTAKVTNATHTGDVTGATALTIATDAVDIAMLSATGTADSTTFLRGDNAWVAPTSGLVEADQWRLTANYTSTNGDITANLERNDTTGFALLGTGMTESSGIFSFPSTGYWLVAPTMGFEVAAGDNCGVETYFTVDHSTGPTWTKQGAQNIGNKGSPKVSQTQISATYVVDVTNTTECKIKFTTESMASTSGILGSTTELITWWTFIKLADT